MPDANASPAVTETFHLLQHGRPRFPQPTAFFKHLEGSFKAGLPQRADAEDARHRRGKLADPSVLGEIVHGFQRKEQMGLVPVCLYRPAHIVEVRAGAQRRQRLFDEEHHFRAGRQGVDNMDAPGGIALGAGLLSGARSAVNA